MTATDQSLMRFSDFPAHHAELNPNAEAAVLGELRYTYRDFAARIDRCAQSLLVAGVRHGDRVATLSNPHPDALIIWLACARIGAIWVGLNTRSQYEELAYVVGDAKPCLLFSIASFEGREYREDTDKLLAQFDCLSALITFNTDPLQCESQTSTLDAFLNRAEQCDSDLFSQAIAQVAPDDPALIVYTSGSTGQPKGALLSHKNIVTSAQIQCQQWPAKPFRILNNLPINHLGGAVQIAAYAVVGGGTNVMMERFSASGTLPLIARESISVIHQTSTMYQLMLDRDKPTDHDLSSLQVLIWSGSACPKDLIAKLRGVCPNLFTSYGQTETGGEVIYTAAGADNQHLASSVGKPPPGVKLRLANEQGRTVAQGEAGEIQVQSTMNMLGYWQRIEASQAAFTADGWLRTGDLAEQSEQGDYRIVGRLKEMYKSGGYNIYPREIEILLENHPAVAIAAVVSVPDPLYSEVGHAFILLEENQNTTEQALKDFCRDKLANYKIPKRFILRTQLPMLPIGKVDKVALKKEASPNKETQ